MIASLPALCSIVSTLTQRVPPLTVVDKPPIARSPASALAPQFHVPFLALEARFSPPSYITVVAPSAHAPTVRGAFICRSMRHPSGSASVAAPASLSYIPSKFCVTLRESGVTSIAWAVIVAAASAMNTIINLVFIIKIV